MPGDAEFRAALHALEPRYRDRHPFHVRLHQGRLGGDEFTEPGTDGGMDAATELPPDYVIRGLR